MSINAVLARIGTKNYPNPMVTVPRILECSLEVPESQAILTQYGTNATKLLTNLAQRLTHDNNPAVTLAAPLTPTLPANTLRYGAATVPYLEKMSAIFMAEMQGQQGQPNNPAGAVAEPSFVHFLKAIYEQEKTMPDNPYMNILKEADFNWDQFLAVETNKNEKNIIAELCINLNELAAKDKIDPVLFRDEEILKVIESLGKRRSNNCILTGKPGVGKTAIPEGLAYKIHHKQVPEILADTTIYSLNIADLMAGTSLRGQLEEKIKVLLNFFKKQNEEGKSTILFIDEIHLVMGQAASGADINNMIKPALAKGELRCIGATTTDEWNAFVRRDKAFARRFEIVDVEEFSAERTIEVLRGAKRHYEAHHSVEYTEDAIKAAVELSVAYINKSALPDKAIQIFDLAGAAARVASKQIVTIKEIEEVLAKWRGINIAIITKDKEKKKRNVRLGAEIKQKVFHQDQAIDAMVKPVERHQAGFAGKNKPIASLLFVGPTGVGKTEAAKALAESLGCKLGRFDMSEYQQEFAVTKLIGSPPGYVGSDQNGALSDLVEKNPYCVILLDEIEKADPKITEIFLQIMDNACFKNNKGEEVDCKNVVLIFTSNAGAKERSQKTVGLGDQASAAASKANAKVNAFFTPEFRNRLNAQVTFNPLTKEQMIPIVEKFVALLNKKEGISSRGMNVELTQAAKEWIVNTGYDEQFGARPIERAIATKIEDALVEATIEGKTENVEQVMVDVVNDELSFNYVPKVSSEETKS